MQRWNYLWSVGMAIVGIVLLLEGFQGYKEGMASASWPKVEGVITSSAAEDSHDSTSFARIEYSYEVSEKPYKGDRIYAESFETAMRRKDAEELVKKFPVGRHGPVSYDPANPQNSLLIPGVGSNIWLPFFGGTVFLIFGFLYFLNVRKSIRA